MSHKSHRRWAAFIAVLVTAGPVAVATPPASATFERTCNPGWIANHSYYVKRLRTFDLRCSTARSVLARYISTGRRPPGWRTYQPGRPFVGGLSRRWGKGALAFNGFYNQ